jgi:hypothetical protein
MVDGIREAAAAERLDVVDVPMILADRGCDAPGREWFLDDVHMTAQGVEVAMSALAERLLAPLGRRPRSGTGMPSAVVTVSPAARGQAHFLASRGLGPFRPPRDTRGDVVTHHCQEAVRADPCIAAAMRSNIRMALASNAEDFYGSFKDIIDAIGRHPAMRQVLYHPPMVVPQCVNLPLLSAMAAAAETVCPGAQAEYEALLDKYVAAQTGTINLIERAIPPERLSWRPPVERSFLRAFTVRTRFQLLCRRNAPISIHITARAPHVDDASPPAVLEVNDIAIHHWRLRPAWTSVRVVLEPTVLVDGFNHVTIRWPDLEYSSETRRQQLLTVMRAGSAVGMGCLEEGFPVYGEVIAMNATLTETGDREWPVRPGAADPVPLV